MNTEQKPPANKSTEIIIYVGHNHHLGTLAANVQCNRMSKLEDFDQAIIAINTAKQLFTEQHAALKNQNLG